jgi:aminopeptidase S
MLTPISNGLVPDSARRALVAMAAVLLLTGCTSSERPVNPAPANPAPASSSALQVAVTTEAIHRDLAALQRIADEHGGNRAAGSPGFNASVAYLTSELRAAGYQPQLQRFEIQADPGSAAQPATNVLVELPGTRGDRVIMIGAHLDSTPEGPGMNDNASGAATTLELARQLAGARLPATVRFAWWDGEELGQLGSGHYVQTLERPARDQIAAYLNLDAIGSPNFVRLVYAADDDAPPGSKVVEQAFTGYFAAKGLPVDLVKPGDSFDQAPFAAAGIPVGGVFTGTEPKTREQQAAYGGTTEAADPCYHQSCDQLGNLNLAVLDQMADAAAHATMTLASDVAAVDRAPAGG